jgi:hypothetical protein
MAGNNRSHQPLFIVPSATDIPWAVRVLTPER